MRGRARSLLLKIPLNLRETHLETMFMLRNKLRTICIAAVFVSIIINVDAIGMGRAHGCVLGIKDVTGRPMKCWGSDKAGQVTKIPKAATKWTLSAAGNLHSCGLDSGFRAYCWGSNHTGQLSVPTKEKVWRYIAAGGDRTCGISSTGRYYCWGSCACSPTTCTPPCVPPTPSTVGSRWDKVSIGSGGHTCWLQRSTATPEIKCAGPNLFGQCNVPKPPNVASGGTSAKVVPDVWKDVVAGGYHTVGLTKTGQIACWGNNGDGQCKIGNLLKTNGTGYFVAIGAGYTSTCALNNANVISCVGKGYATPTTNIPTGIKWTNVAVGGGTGYKDFACGHTAPDLRIVCWGDNSNGQSKGPGGTNTFY